MPQVTHETARSSSRKRGDIRFAYRHFGLLGDTPLAAAELLCGELRRPEAEVRAMLLDTVIAKQAAVVTTPPCWPTLSSRKGPRQSPPE
jgi:hypothetical protein